jgi:hypothetical protein
MSITLVRRIPCRRCGREIEAVTLESANIMRHPHFQDQLLERRLLRMSCPRCGAVHLHFDRFMWTDLPGRFCAIVLDESERPSWADLEEEARDAIAVPFAEGPPVVRELGAALTIRLVFGLDELREKVLCRMHELDDRDVEALKIELPYGCVLEGVVPGQTLTFMDGDRAVGVRWRSYADMAGRRGALAAELPGIFDPQATWVNVGRARRAPWHDAAASA